MSKVNYSEIIFKIKEEYIKHTKLGIRLNTLLWICLHYLS